MHIRHVWAPLVGFEHAPSIEADLAERYPDPDRAARKRFPLRYLRYWFVRHALESLRRELDRPLRVLEVGVGRGQMLAFMGGAANGDGAHALPESIERWDALSGHADPETLRRYAYTNFRRADLDAHFAVGEGEYDAVIVLHVLEHLKRPETTLRALLPALRSNGALIGGSPTMPALFAPLQERHLRRKYADVIDDVTVHKHISVISPQRIRRFASAEALSVEFLAGAFFLRASRNPLESYAWWLRANLLWGALLPSLGGEVYFALRKRGERPHTPA